MVCALRLVLHISTDCTPPKDILLRIISFTGQSFYPRCTLLAQDPSDLNRTEFLCVLGGYNTIHVALIPARERVVFAAIWFHSLRQALNPDLLNVSSELGYCFTLYTVPLSSGYIMQTQLDRSK